MKKNGKTIRFFYKLFRLFVSKKCPFLIICVFSFSETSISIPQLVHLKNKDVYIIEEEKNEEGKKTQDSLSLICVCTFL